MAQQITGYRHRSSEPEMKLLVICLTFGLAAITPTSALSCASGGGPCEPPICCSSGVMTKDVCGLCLTCAKDVGDTCGGPFNSGGICSNGLSCLRTCPQQSPGFCAAQTRLGDRACVFPFSFKGKTYTSCTTDDSENGKAWCAYQVDRSGNVIINRWGDCTPGCFASECLEVDLENADGRCISNALLRPSSEQQRIDPGASSPVFTTSCPGRENRCVCSPRRTTGASEGEGCDPSVQSPWCFLENIQDVQNPIRDCFEDVFFSQRWGRFYSSEACKDPFSRSTLSGGPPGLIFD